jgi:steroid delta-isomerase-like uncharacterized protein
VFEEEVVTDSTNKQVVQKYVEAFNRGDIEALRPLFTEDAVVHGVLGWGTVEQVIPIWELLHSGFAASLHVDAMVEEGDVVAVRYTERGTSVGEFRGQGPTGKSYEIVAMEWFEMEDGRIRRRWGARDMAAQHRQMGLSLE